MKTYNIVYKDCNAQILLTRKEQKGKLFHQLPQSTVKYLQLRNLGILSRKETFTEEDGLSHISYFSGNNF